MTRYSCAYAWLVVVLVAAVDAHAQSDPAFEVASIKKNTSGTNRQFMDASGGRYTATNVPVRFLIQSAYRLQNMQLVGGPRWIDSDHFDIVASRGGRPVDELPAMLRTLLAERFALKVHHESRDMPMYTLVVAKSDNTLGPRLTVATCEGRPVSSFPGPNDRVLPCDSRFAAPGRLRVGGVRMRDLASLLTGIVGRIVIDKTGLDGTYDAEMTWTPDQPRPVDAPVPDTDGGTVFTALQEQLGLKLAGGRGAVDVVVIDSISPPTEN